MNQTKSLLLLVIAIGALLLIVGVYLLGKSNGATDSTNAPSQAYGISGSAGSNSVPMGNPAYPDLSGSPSKPPPPSVEISADGNICRMIVPSDLAGGVKAIDTQGRNFTIQAGDQIRLELAGKVQIGSDRPIIGPEGETSGYRDTGVSSPFKSNVGGLEFSIGPLSANRYLASKNVSFRSTQTGVPTFNVIETPDGYKDGNLGFFRVTITRIK